MCNLLQVYYVVLPYVELFYVLTMGKVSERGNAVVRQGYSLQALHFSDKGDTIDLLAPHIDVLYRGNVIVFDFMLLLDHLAGESFLRLVRG